MSRAGNLAAAFFACALIGSAGSARSADAPRRLGIFVGSNAAPAGRETLRHGISDAARLRSVFIELGGIRPGDAHLLESPGADTIVEAIRSLGAALANQPEALVVFYYSGHADDRALLLGATELPIAQLKAELDALPVRLNLQLIDACRSGALTRRKGAKLGRPFSVHAAPVGEGRVVITSSAEYEDSQESDRLGGSFFTVHLASGLRGAADADQDGSVTLAEAYGYVYGRTVESTLGTTAGPQHPTFLYDMQGRGDFVLTWPGSGPDAATVELAAAGDYLIVDANNGRVVAEVRARPEGERLALRAGRYRVKKRGRSMVEEGTLDLAPGQEVVADEHLTRRIRHAELVRKGGGPLAAHTLWVDAGVRGPLGADLEASPLVRIAYSVALPWLTIRPRVGLAGVFGADPVVTPRLRYDLRELTAGVELQRAYDLRYVTVSGGVVADMLFLRQREQQRLEPDRTTTGFVVGAVAGVATTPLLGVSLMLTAEADAYSFRSTAVDRTPTGDGELRTELTYRTLLSLGYAL